MNALVDTPIWSLALRRRRGDLSSEERRLVFEWQELVREGRVCLLGAVRQEVLSGIRRPSDFERLRDHLADFPDERVATGDHEEAARYYNTCQSHGIAGTQVDFLICALASRKGLSVYTTDEDFIGYAKRVPVHLHVPRTEKY